MRNNIWKKGLILGIIILFFGAGVLPSVCGKLVAPTIDDNTVNHSTHKYTLIAIGLLTDKIYISKNDFCYTVLLGYIIGFFDGKYAWSTAIIDAPFGFHYGFKIGILADHFVCAIFFNYS